MVRWFGPAQLLRTAGSVIISSVFGAVFDRRRIDARLSDDEALTHDLARDASGAEREQFVFDYISDTGDGWNSTYAVAYWSSQPELSVTTHDGARSVTTRRADAVIFGGDLVYPAPSADAYRDRLTEPFRHALGRPRGETPQVFAIPGNHDWYDNLAHFTRLFIDAPRVAGRLAPQRRSYFALELPRGWWLLGVDVQLSSDLDRDQVEFFRRVTAKIHERARSCDDAGDDPPAVILCTGEPYWVLEQEAGTPWEAPNLKQLERDLLGDERIRVYLAGDLHHYRRHASDDGRRQRITAGGGGAFLHPTHSFSDAPMADGCELRSAYPAPALTRRMTWRNLLFPIVSPTFGVFSGLLYLYAGWYTVAELRWSHDFSVIEIVLDVLRALAHSPGAGTTFAVILGGFILFTNARNTWYRALGGGLHGLAHIVAITVLVGSLGAAASALGWEHLGLAHLGLTIFGLFLGGWLLGSLLMGAYLFLSIRVFNIHVTEGFSGLAIQDYKHFLRLVIDERGDLTILPIGVDRVPRAWVEQTGDQEGSTYAPAPEDRATAPHLIEAPIRVPR